MSWDVIIAKTTDANYAKPADDAELVRMGRVNEVRTKVATTVPSINWSLPGEGHAQIGALSLDFSFLGKATPSRPHLFHANN